MKWISFLKEDGKQRCGILSEEGFVIDIHEATCSELPDNLLEYLEGLSLHEEKVKALTSLKLSDKGTYPFKSIKLLAPLPKPKSLRDFYAFEQHVKTARENRGLEMIPEWYEIPVFYFSNHMAIKGPGETINKPGECEWLDYELEVAAVIGKEGSDIPAAEAENYIFGFMILNDWSARDLQRKEMKVGLGPAKGKDFATSTGPWILTKEELEDYRKGKGYNLQMTAHVNGKLLSQGNMGDLYYSFGEMIERASAGVTLYPGEIIGSGTVGTGCILELGADAHRWLQPGDEVELQIEKLGVLKNKIE
ncbi:fumarylacetoacetate hydrolase family protein [Neobacillus terrae]|uniref:fumarylacetoacetate hydrolase family protein n=1 Tax=Neobacillus terrae TaxID=3034837 RepID=UPI00140DD661|nr:fumarylacetoacetate hydrolase family protein [Neobacillus terrae]NHM31044.1 fumarylacetoacetate hydrolase family protein [Neobacillus terrae]